MDSMTWTQANADLTGVGSLVQGPLIPRLMKDPQGSLLQNLSPTDMTVINWTKKKNLLGKKKETCEQNPVMSGAEAKQHIRGEMQ